MRPLREIPIPDGVPHHVTREPDSVNPARSSSTTGPPRTPRRYTPHMMLAAQAHELRLSYAALLALKVLLWGANKRGRGQGCGPNEAVTFLRHGGLAEAMGIAPGKEPGRSNTGSVKRALVELRALGLVRWVRVNAWERLPDVGGTGDVFTGKRTSGCCVYYVNIGACWAALGRPDLASPPAPKSTPGTSVADEIKFDLAMRSGTVLSRHENIGQLPGTTVAPVVNCELNHKPQPQEQGRSQGNATHPPPVVVVGVDSSENEKDLDAAHAYWLERIGTPRGCPPHVCLAVREALRAAMAAGLTLGNIVDVVDGATVRELGGRSYDWIHEPGRGRLFGPGLFWCADRGRVSGVVSFLLQTVPGNRKRLERAAIAAQASRERAPTPTSAEADRIMSPREVSRYLALRREGVDDAEAQRRVREELASPAATRRARAAG